MPCCVLTRTFLGNGFLSLIGRKWEYESMKNRHHKEITHQIDAKLSCFEQKLGLISFHDIFGWCPNALIWIEWSADFFISLILAICLDQIPDQLMNG